MNIALFIAALTASVFIIYQDFKFREINLLLIIGFVIIIAARSLYIESTDQIILNSIFCMLYFAISYLVLRVYFFVKNKRSEKLIDEKIGWADIILLFIIGCTLEPEHMIVFFGSVFILPLLLHLVILKNTKQIPLAAYLMIIYNSYQLFNYFATT